MICSVAGCDREFYAKGCCFKHYKRLRAHGDPLGGRIEHGAARDFVASLVNSNTDECIAWPFGKTKDGYGRVNWQRVPQGAHVVATMLSHGPKPTPKHEACHRCGKGHLGCVNPRHLYWGTRKDNVRDAIEHGTSHSLNTPSGEAHRWTKYSDATIRDVMAAIHAGERPSVIVRQYGISWTYYYSLKSGAYRTAPVPPCPVPLPQGAA